MSDIESFIDAVSDQNFTDAGPIFQELMATKLHDALEAEKVKVAGVVFSDDDLDISDDELDDIDLNDEEYDDEDEESDED